MRDASRADDGIKGDATRRHRSGAANDKEAAMASMQLKLTVYAVMGLAAVVMAATMYYYS